MKRDQWGLVLVAGLLSFTAMLDANIVNVALPTIGRDFHIGPSLTTWVVLGYFLPLAALLLPGGRWLDQVGHRPALLFAVGGFLCANVAAGFAPNPGVLIGARVVQGAFAALLFALMPALATVAVRPEARARAMSVLATLGPLGAVSGPAIGGILLDAFGWRSIFFVELPVCLVAIGIGRRALPADQRWRAPQWQGTTEVVLLAGAVSAILLALNFGGDNGSAWFGLALVAVVPLMAWWRLSTSRPVRRLLRMPALAGPHLAVLCLAVSFAAMFVLMPFYLQRILGASAATTGLVVLAFPLGMGIAGPVGGFAADRWGSHRMAIIGAVVTTGGLLLVLPLGQGWTPTGLAWRLAVAGIGMGLYGGPTQAMVMSAAPSQLIATTAATVQLARTLGFALGPALAIAIWARSGYALVGMRAGLALAVITAFLAVVALCFSLVRRHPARRKKYVRNHRMGVIPA